MMLHNDSTLFNDLVLRTSEDTGIDAAIIEKDYYVSVLLRRITELLPDIILKGGTSLSKCYHIIDRFSEDIDLSVFEYDKPTQAQRRELKCGIIRAIDDIGLELENGDQIRSRRDFNRYIIGYPSTLKSDIVNRKLLVETAVFLGVFPTEKRQAGNYIYDYLCSHGLTELVDDRHIRPFELKVQCPDRTFVDKVFALCDYYLTKNTEQHSRHIYDLYRLSKIVSLDDRLRELAKKVRKERKSHSTCVSAKDGYEIKRIITEMIKEEAFRADYNKTTYRLLFTKVGYEDAIRVFDDIMLKSIFDE